MNGTRYRLSEKLSRRMNLWLDGLRNARLKLLKSEVKMGMLLQNLQK